MRSRHQHMVELLILDFLGLATAKVLRSTWHGAWSRLASVNLLQKSVFRIGRRLRKIAALKRNASALQNVAHQFQPQQGIVQFHQLLLEGKRHG